MDTDGLTEARDQKSSLDAEVPASHIVGGPGATRAILAVAGMLLALRYLELNRYGTVGGVSGGSIPLALAAGGQSEERVAETAIALNFADLIEKLTPMSRVIRQHYLSGRRRNKRRPLTGKFRADRLGQWIENATSGAWPEHFWTMAVHESTQVLCTAHGVFARQEGGLFVPLSDRPAPIGLAIQASCAVPGFFHPVAMPLLEGGSKILLYDGGLSWEGRRPMTVVEEHFKAKSSDIVLCDVGPDTGRNTRMFSKVWRLVCGARCVTARGRKAPNEDRAVVIEPSVTSVTSFDFDAHTDRKWQALMEGFAATVYALNRSCRLTPCRFWAAKDVIAQFNELSQGLAKAPPLALTKRTEKLLVDAGVL